MGWAQCRLVASNRSAKSNVALLRKRTIMGVSEAIRMLTTAQFRYALAVGMVAALWLGLGLCARASTATPVDSVPVTELDRGFRGLYNLDFAGAQRDFSSWETQHPDDPVGPVSQAAGFLFSEFNRLGVLEGQFYENDDSFAARSKLSPDPVLRNEFQSAVDHAEALAHVRLSKDAKDRDALFALTLASGLQADYEALIEKKNLASLHY